MKIITHLFRVPTAVKLAERELAEAELELHQYRHNHELAAAWVSYEMTRVNRLKTFLADAREAD